MQIGIVAVLNPDYGGIYQYSVTALHALDELKGDGWEDRFIVLTD